MKIYNQMVAKCLREVRNARGFLQSDLSNMLGIDRTTYLNYESGKYKVHGYYLTKISRFYGIPLDVLIMADDEFFYDFLKRYKRVHQAAINTRTINNIYAEILRSK